MPLFNSIRVSLTICYSMTLAAILLLYSVFLFFSVKAQLFEKTDYELLQVATSLTSSVFEPFRENPSTALEQVLSDFLGEKYQHKLIQFVSPDGRIQFKSAILESASLPIDSSQMNSLKKGITQYDTETVTVGMPARYISVPIISEGKLVSIVQAGSYLDGEAALLESMKIIIWVSIPVATIILGFGGWFLAGRALKPVDEITRSAELIDDRHLDTRLAVVNPHDEIGRLANAFNRTLERLEQGFERTRRFSVDVSHELRTPLTILKGETEVGLKWAKEKDEFKEILGNNLEEINRMASIIEFLLEISRIEEGKQRIHRDIVDISTLIAELAAKSETEAKEQGISILTEFSDEALVAGDEQRLKQMFGHLINNAFRFSPSGGTLTLKVSASETSVEAAVIDTGIGIPPEDIPYIFDRFYRVDKSRNRSAGGSGLGLSLVKSLADAHGATIVVKSEPGFGSRFIVVFPAAEKIDEI